MQIASSFIASCIVNTAGNSSYSTFISFTAFSAISGVSAATAATRSPTNLTVSENITSFSGILCS